MSDTNTPINPIMEQYKAASPGAFWESIPMRGIDGYSVIELAGSLKLPWHVMGSWGKDGYDLGSWPIVIVFYRTIKETSNDNKITYQVAEYVEGDVTLWNCPSEQIREAITDEIAFYHWKWNDESWVKDYNSVAELPADLRGPCRFEKEEEKKGA